MHQNADIRQKLIVIRFSSFVVTGENTAVVGDLNRLLLYKQKFGKYPFRIRFHNGTKCNFFLRKRDESESSIFGDVIRRG